MGRVKSQPFALLLHEFESEYSLANTINTIFTNNFIQSGNISEVHLTTEGRNKYQKHVSVSEVSNEINKLKLSKSSPTSDLPKRLYKEAVTIISVPLCHIFNTSLETSIVPDAWKLAEIIPVPKRMYLILKI